VPVLSARGVSKAYGPQTLFSNVSLTVTRGERVGLLGVNGTGKSTLLRVLAGVEPADEGTIDRRREATILFLEQEPKLDPKKTPHQIVEEGLSEWKAAVDRHHAISKRIEAGETQLIEEQSKLGELVERLGGWTRAHVVEDMLTKLGVRDIDRAVGTMSGGELRRVALAKVLVARPMLAILDEPTNHLDTSTIDWLEEFFANEWDGAILMVTHDRYVLDAICDRIIELDRGSLVEYQGGYSDYLEQKAERLAHEERVEANRLNILRREKAWLMRGAKARTTKQKARIQRANKLMADEPTAPPPRVDLASVEVSAAEMGKKVLDLESVTISIGERVLVRDLDLHVLGRDRIGIIGPNGAGKTSLLKAITGELSASKGNVVLGTRTKVTLFDQARAQLRDDWSVIDNVCEREGSDRTAPQTQRQWLEQFLFDGSKQRQKVGSLSGGERARVALAKILMGGANLLLLDEPTNDLDVATLSSLEELLESWPGSVIAVSHDRYFLDRVATSILVFEDDKVTRYAGNYTAYLAQRRLPIEAPKRASAPPPPNPKPAEKKKLTYAEKIELEGILDTIGAMEDRVREIEKALCDPAQYANARQLAADLDVAKADVAKLIARWELLESKR
jgi:ATP-binding cassette subfamily F protein uup